MYSTTVNPCFSIQWKLSSTVFGIFGHSTKVKALNCRCLVDAFFESYKRRLAFARFLGFLYSPFSLSLIFSKSLYDRIHSPRTITLPVSLIFIGSPLIQRALCVTFSPISPLPRVAAIISCPFSYVATTVIPSIFHDKTPS